MPKPDRQQQRRAEARALQQTRPLLSPDMIRARKLAALPIASAWLREDWQKPAQLVVAAIARRRPDGDLAVVTLLADLGCLGVKQSKFYAQVAPADLPRLLDKATEYPMARVPIATLARVVRESARWAVDCGFPVRDAQEVAVAFLGGDASDDSVEVPLGTDGKPMLIPGPFDDFDELAAILTHRFGPGGFHYIAPI